LSERSIVNRVYESILRNKEAGRHYWLRKAYKHKNLSTKEFQQIWSEWWRGIAPPRVEADLILIFEDPIKLIDEALIGCVEVEYFSGKDIGKKNFYEGLQQTLAFSVFGFDGLSLWHIFAKDVKDETIKNYSDAMEELVRGFKLQIFYLATKILDEDELTLKCFKPCQLEKSIDYFIDSFQSYWVMEGNRNPVLKDSKIKDRRKVIKTLLKIPV
jgi:hypothetical protein